jgi:hypothetical protein
MMLMPCKVERIVAEKSVKSAKSGSKKSSKFYFIKWVRFVQRESEITIKNFIIISYDISISNLRHLCFLSYCSLDILTMRILGSQSNTFLIK